MLHFTKTYFLLVEKHGFFKCELKSFTWEPGAGPGSNGSTDAPTKLTYMTTNIETMNMHITPKELNSEFTPEKLWLEDDPFLSGPGNF